MGSRWLAAASLVGACILGACTPSPPLRPSPATTPLPATSSGPCTGVSIAASRPSPVTAGQPVVLNASARGCALPQFRFVLADATATSGSIVQDWSASPAWFWSTVGVAGGQYVVRVDARSLTSPGVLPDASAYLAVAVVAGVAPTVQTCKLPVSGDQPGSGGFVQMPAGTFTVDRSSDVEVQGQPDQAGLRVGLTYDPLHGTWLPVPRDWVMADYSSYVYLAPGGGAQPDLHRVNLATGADTVWPNGPQLYGHPIALRADGVYGAPGPEIITRVDRAGGVTTVDQGHYGLFAVITPDAIWATRNAGFSSLTDVQRIDPKTQAATDWFKASAQAALPIGVDGDGHPIIAVGKQLPSGRISAGQIWIVPQPAAAAGPAANFAIYDDPAHPLTIMGWPILSAGAIWVETDRGLWVDENQGPMRQVSSFSGFIAGGCL